MNLFKDILSGVWMISEMEAQALHPIVNRLLNGDKSIDMSLFVNQQAGSLYKSDSKLPAQDVLVIPIKGVITKYDYCGDMGMLSFEQILKQALYSPNIGAVVLDIDSGGGEASYMGNIAQALRDFKAVKPLIGYYSGLCASAAYYIGSQCAELYASSPTDMVGSSGTLMTIRRPNPDFKDNPTITENIYADQSTHKNIEFEKALKGDYSLLKSNILNPFTEQFHKDVLAGRPQISKDALNAQCVMSDKAIAMNMIDGIKSFDEVISQAQSLLK